MNENKVLAGALSVARRGWYVFPCAGKNPRIKDWPNKASVDEKTVKTWWERWPDSNVGVACGPSGLWVIDVDDDDGRAWVAQADLPATLSVRTGSGGEHYYFQRGDHQLGNTAKRVPGIDTRGDGGFVVVPPSIHPETGQAYEWKHKVRIADVPARLVEIFGQPREVQRVAAPYVPTQVPDSYGQAALEGECAKVCNAPQGQRNETLNVAAFNLGTVVGAGLLPESVARSDLHAAAMAAGLDETETLKTIDSGMRAGLGKPRQVATRNRQPLRVVGQEERAPSHNVVDQVASEHPKWRSKVQYRDDGKVAKGYGNTIEIITAEAGELLAYDEMTATAKLLEKPPWGGEGQYPKSLSDDDVTRCRGWLSRLGVEASREDIVSTLQMLAGENRYNTLRWYLEGLRWDGTPRLDAVASTFLSAAAVPSDELMARWMLSAVARALLPGCKADHVLILEGRQGAGKSSALKTLALHWFCDEMITPKDKDSTMTTARAWIVELQELDALSKADATAIKAWVTKTEDRLRLPFGRFIVEWPRHFVFAGTTNEGTYLKDPTGARRWWPIVVGKVDFDGLENCRDQLWAEAVQRFRAGEQWHELRPETLEALDGVRADKEAEDPWEPAIRAWLDDVSASYVTTNQALRMAGVDISKATHHDTKRMANIIKKCGWDKRVKRREGATTLWAWERGANTGNNGEHTGNTAAASC